MNRRGLLAVLVTLVVAGLSVGVTASSAGAQTTVLVQEHGRGDGPRSGAAGDPRPAPRMPLPPRPWRPSERRGSYQEAAFSRGYADGYMRGLDDRRDRDRYDPVGDKAYRRGDAGYSNDYGSRDAYKNNYRAGFRQGYDEGYRDGVKGGR